MKVLRNKFNIDLKNGIANDIKRQNKLLIFFNTLGRKIMFSVWKTAFILAFDFPLSLAI